MPKRLKNSVLDLIKSNKDCKRKLEDIENKSPFTLYEWLRSNNPSLCQISYLEVISHYTGIAIEDLYEEQ